MYPDPMTKLPPINGVVKLEVIGSTGTQSWANIFHALYTPSTSPLTTAQLSAIASNLASSWNPYITALYPSSRLGVETVVTDLNAAGLSYVGPTVGAGTRSGTALPAQVATVIDFNSSAPRYRGGHPRISIPGGVTSDLLDIQHWSSTFIAAANTAWTNFSGGIFNVAITGGVTVGSQCVVSYFSGKSLRPTPLAYSINSFSTRSLIGTVRRRVGRPPRF